MTGPFAEYAQIYYDLGLAPTPLGYPNSPKPSKAAGITGWQSLARSRMTRDRLDELVHTHGNLNIGLVMGTEVQEGLQICAIDIDNEKYQEDVEAALPSLSCGKRGKKGATYFFLADSNFAGRRITNAQGTVVDFLAHKSQTAIPPSIHPDTLQPYKWLSKPLYEFDLRELDVITDETLMEIEAIARGAAEYFVGGYIEKVGDFPGLNNMVYMGQGEGGNTHDTVLRAVAHMMGTGWGDAAIVARVRRAMRGAYERGGQEWDDPSWLTRNVTALIEDGKKKGIAPKARAGKQQQVPVERTWAEWLTSQFEWPTYYGSEVFSYANGYYSKHVTESVQSKVVRTFPMATSEKASGAFKTFCLLNYKPDFGSASNDKICMRNGTLDISSMVLRNWQPEDELLYQMDVEWDPEATCPKYEEFLTWVFDGDEESIAMFEEYAGLSFVDDMTFQRTLWMVGPGGNGKSTLISLLTALHDPKVVSTIPISDIGDERKLTSMVGKLLNISTEQSRLNQMTDTIFKQITGGDPVAVRRLFSEVDNNVRLKVRFLCLTNEMPSTADSSEAMRRRMMILTCPNSVPNDKKDPMLGAKLLKEKQGIIKRWVLALNKLRERGRFQLSDSSEVSVDEFLVANDPLRMWMGMSYTPDQEMSTQSLELYVRFSEWAKMAGYKGIFRYPEFMQKMRSMKIPIEYETLPGGSKVQMIYGNFNGSDGGYREF